MSDMALGMGYTSNPKKPICISMTDNRDSTLMFGGIVFPLKQAREWGEELVSFCDRYEAFREKHAADFSQMPEPKLNPGPNETAT